MLLKRENNERTISYVFKMDVDPDRNPSMKICRNSENQIVCDIVDKDGQYIEATLIEIQGSYKGKTHERILFTQPVTDGKFIVNVNNGIGRFDAILVVDTSYDPWSNPKMAFTSIMVHKRVSIEDGYFYTPRLVEWDATDQDKPENTMYCYAIQCLIDEYKSRNEVMPEVAMVIDSDLADIRSYNNRSKPIYGKFYLPDIFFLFYAKDKGDFYQNKLLKMCDNEAKKALREYNNAIKINSKTKAKKMKKTELLNDMTQIS